MKYKTTVMKFTFGFIAILVLSVSANAQDNLDQLVSQYKSDGNYLITSYIDPFMKTLNLSLNQGWYNTAKPHKVAGVDLTVTVNAMYIPSSDKKYSTNNLQQIELKPGQTQFSNGNVPTIFGKEETPIYHPKGSTDPSEEFSGPKGLDLKKSIGINALPVPMVQLGFGLPKGFDVKFRYFPKYKIGDDGHVQMFGIGVMHDIKQYLPGIKLLPFDLSAFVGYTQIKLDYGMSGEVAGSDQRAVYNINATTIQGVISKKMSVITVYGGLGYNIAKSELAVKGTYDTNNDGTYDPSDPQDTKDPYKHDFAASGPRVSAGARLKLAVFTLHADYTVQKYSCLTVGFGISVR
jgi:hypothetical protein